MQPFPSISRFGQNASGSAYDSGWLSFQQSTTVALEKNYQKEIVLQTDEGDTVTLSYGRQSSATCTRYDAAGLLLEDDVSSGSIARTTSAIVAQGRSYTFFDSREMAITVEGSLSEAELSDIKEAIGAIDRLMTPLLAGGNAEAVIGKAEKLLSLDTISDIQANYSFTQSATFLQSSSLEHLASAQNELPAADAEAPEAGEDVLPNDIFGALSSMMATHRMGQGKWKHPLRQLFANMKNFSRNLQSLQGSGI